MPRKKTGLASSTKKRYIKSTCHCLILCQNIVGGLYTIISEGKFTQSRFIRRLVSKIRIWYDAITFKEERYRVCGVSPIFCVYDEPSTDLCLHKNLYLANVHHRAFKRDGVQGIQIE